MGYGLIEDLVEHFTDPVHVHHHLHLRSLQVEAFNQDVGYIPLKALVHMSAQNGEELLLGDSLSLHPLQFRQQLLAPRQDAPPHIVVSCVLALQQSIYRSSQSHNAERLAGRSFLIVNDLLGGGSLHDVAG